MKDVKLALVCTMGGHFEQMVNLKRLYEEYDHFWITNKNRQTEDGLKGERKYFVEIAHFKEPWKYLGQIPSLVRIFRVEKPTHIISTGSGRTAFIPFLLSGPFRSRFIHIDTFSRVNGLSKFGRFLNKVKHEVCVQWEKDGLKNIRYVGPVFSGSNDKLIETDRAIVFVALGTRVEQFSRLLDYMERLKLEKVIDNEVVVQAGHTKFSSVHMKIFDFCSPDEIDNLIRRSAFVVTQESAGIATKCLRYGTRFIVCQRDYKCKELPTASDMEEDLHFKLEELGYTKVVRDYEEIKDAVNSLDTIKSGYVFNNDFAVSSLRSIIEEHR